MCSFGVIHFSNALPSKLSDFYFNDKCLKIEIHLTKPQIAFAIFSFFSLYRLHCASSSDLRLYGLVSQLNIFQAIH